MDAILYLIPVTLGETPHERVLPGYNRGVIVNLKHFIVENIRTARRFLKRTEPTIDIDTLHFFELNEHTKPEEIAALIAPLEAGFSMGLMSEAGCPAVADPGAAVVALAQKRGFRITPLIGPSSLLLALMASGLNGQRFAFHGYLPVETAKCAAAIRSCEARVYAENETQIFIETPYRNNKLMEQFVKTCRAETLLCVASELTCAGEIVKTRTIAEWKRTSVQLGKCPAVFLIGTNYTSNRK
jgi:16S rRNA (cytidine1402-2'-O)-methyltransferase